MTTEVVISPVKDDKMNSHVISQSEIWKIAYHPDDLNEEIRGKHSRLYEYHIRFDGLKPIQMTKFREI